jgi:hypothetical protein
MLGLRRYRGVQIDLFQGTPATFASDLGIALSGGAPDPVSLLTESARRHVAFWVAPEVGPDPPLAAMRAFLDRERPPTHLRRVTFVLSTLEHYHSFQESLFRLYPEPDD